MGKGEKIISNKMMEEVAELENVRRFLGMNYLTLAQKLGITKYATSDAIYSLRAAQWPTNSVADRKILKKRIHIVLLELKARWRLGEDVGGASGGDGRGSGEYGDATERDGGGGGEMRFENLRIGEFENFGFTTEAQRIQSL